MRIESITALRMRYNLVTGLTNDQEGASYVSCCALRAFEADEIFYYYRPQTFLRKDCAVLMILYHLDFDDFEDVYPKLDCDEDGCEKKHSISRSVCEHAVCFGAWVKET